MAVRLKRLWNSLELSTSSPGSPVFTATAYTGLTSVVVENHDTVARTVTVYIIRSGQAAALDAAERIVNAKSIPPGTQEELSELVGQALNPTDMIYMVASAASALTAHGSGVEVDA
jgi:hypothetical protein